jgi:plastocyanin
MKCFSKIILFAHVCAGVTSAPAEAVIEGKVKLPKFVAPAMDVSRYKNVNASDVARPSPPVAVVYLEGTFPTTSATNVSAKVIQERFQFLPAVLPIRVGTTVEFPNLDDAYHNVFSYSKIKRFDLGRYRNDEKPAAVTFDKPGVVKLYCEIHEHMRATILVLDTPHFVCTDTNGTFRLEHLPAGKFTAKAWVDDRTELKREVQLKDGEITRVDFTVR